MLLLCLEIHEESISLFHYISVNWNPRLSNLIFLMLFFIYILILICLLLKIDRMMILSLNSFSLSLLMSFVLYYATFMIYIFAYFNSLSYELIDTLLGIRYFMMTSLYLLLIMESMHVSLSLLIYFDEF